MAKRTAATLHVVTITPESKPPALKTPSASVSVPEAGTGTPRRKPAPRTEATEDPPIASPAKKPSPRVTRPPASKQAHRTPARRASKSGLDLSVEVLRRSAKPMRMGDIAKAVIKAGWKTSGKTPDATLASAIFREIKEKGKASRFKKTASGLYTVTAAASRK